MSKRCQHQHRTLVQPQIQQGTKSGTGRHGSDPTATSSHRISTPGPLHTWRHGQPPAATTSGTVCGSIFTTEATGVRAEARQLRQGTIVPPSALVSTAGAKPKTTQWRKARRLRAWTPSPRHARITLACPKGPPGGDDKAQTTSLPGGGGRRS